MPFTDSVKMVDVAIVDLDKLNATPSDVANGKSFVGSTKHLESGILPDLANRDNIVLNAGLSVGIPYGINRRAYTVKAEDLNVQTAGTAGPNQLLNPYTAWVNGDQIVGNMSNNGSENDELACGQSHRISQGYHDGTGIISAKSLASQTMASILPNCILEGNTAWANGEELIGTMPNRGTESQTLQAGQSHRISEGYHNGNGIIQATSLASQTPGNATAYEIVEGHSAWVNGQQVNGTMPANEAETIVLPLNGTYNIPNGYHTGNGKVTQNIESQGSLTVGPSKDPQVLQLAGKYMTGNVTITGVDALNYTRNNGVMKDPNGNLIQNYTLSVSSNTAVVKIYVDNWHDNATFNLYHVVFSNLVDASSAAMNLDCLIAIDWTDQTAKTYTFGPVTITIDLEASTNSHKFTISGITSGKVTITELLAAREYGTTNV